MGLLPDDPLRHAGQDATAPARLVRLQQEMLALDLGLPLADVLARMTGWARTLTDAAGCALYLREDGGGFVCRAVGGAIAAAVGDALAGPGGDQAPAAMPQTDGALLRAPLRTATGVLGWVCVAAGPHGAFGAQALAELQVLGESFAATLVRHGSTAQWRAAGEQYRLLFDHNPFPMWVSDLRSRQILAVNQAAVLHYGYSEQEFLAMDVRDLWLPEDRPEWEKTLRSTEEVQKVTGIKRRHRRKDGSVIDTEISADLVDFNGRRARLVLASDVSLRVRAERELARASRAQRMLSACNEVQIRAGTEQALIEEVCRITVEIGGYGMAWAGWLRGGSLQLAAQVGDDSGLLTALEGAWSDPAHAALRHTLEQALASGQLAVAENLAGQPAPEPWARLALAHGFQGAAFLPLGRAGGALGLLGLCTREPLVIGAEEAKLLQDLANDLAFGIEGLRAQARQQALQSAVARVAAAVSAGTGTAFFEQLVRSSTETLGAHGGFVARLHAGGDGEPAQARTLAAVALGQSVADFDFALDGSPLAPAPEETHGTVQGTAVEQFAARVLPGLPSHTCIWRRLDSASGRPLGAMALLFDSSRELDAMMASTLHIFATRAAAEIERQEADAQIRDQASLLDKAQDAIIVRSLEDRVLFWNRSAERLYGWTPQEAMGRSISHLLHDDAQAYQQAIRHVLALGEWSGEFTQHRKDGSSLTVEAHWTLVRDAQGTPRSILAINTDITQRKVTELQIQKLAFFDPLTGLPNRIRLVDRLQHALATGARNGRGGALLFIDLDNFKTLNDTLGHDKGDLLLQQVATRLKACVRESDTVARLGGDEFVVMLEQLSGSANETALQSRTVAENVLGALNQPFDLMGYEHRGTCSIGIAPFVQTEEVGELLKRADLAMYQAKTAGRNTLRFFDPDMQQAVTARAALESDLRQALAQDEFLLHWQPQVDSQGEMLGVEALLRWKHPQRGMVSPAVFIPLAEETGSILPLGRWVLETACAQIAAWAARPETAGLTVAVNVSVLQFRHPDFVDQVLAELDKAGANPRRLKLELTESLLVSDMEETVTKMAALKRRGVCFSLDDFGTGYSSLYYLKRLPLDQLKIDQSFVRDLLSDPNDAAIVRTIVALAQSLGLHVIAEGVENESQQQFLAEHGCHAYQGYLFSRPLAAEQLQAFLEARTHAA
jgi:diguanylate cyclase (GGDEF)-like protein/PAS domain S-box-containing protein